MTLAWLSLVLADEPTAPAPLVFAPVVVQGEVQEPQIELVTARLPTHGTAEQERHDAVVRGLAGVAALK